MTPAKKKPSHDLGWHNFYLRLQRSVLERLRYVADQETQRTKIPVDLTKIMRKFIEEGLEEWEERNAD